MQRRKRHGIEFRMAFVNVTCALLPSRVTGGDSDDTQTAVNDAFA